MSESEPAARQSRESGESPGIASSATFDAVTMDPADTPGVIEVAALDGCCRGVRRCREEGRWTIRPTRPHTRLARRGAREQGAGRREETRGGRPEPDIRTVLPRARTGRRKPAGPDNQTNRTARGGSERPSAPRKRRSWRPDRAPAPNASPETRILAPNSVGSAKPPSSWASRTSLEDRSFFGTRLGADARVGHMRARIGWSCVRSRPVRMRFRRRPRIVTGEGSGPVSGREMKKGPTTRAVARNLWLGGKTESEVAKAVGTSLRNVVRWREREAWQDLKMMIEARPVTAAMDQATTAEERELKMLDVVDNILIRILQKGAQEFTPRDVKLFTASIKEASDIRHETYRLRRIRDYHRELAEKEAAKQAEARTWRSTRS